MGLLGDFFWPVPGQLVSAGLSHVSGLELLLHSNAWQLANSWGNWILLLRPLLLQWAFLGLFTWWPRVPSAAGENNSQCVFFKPWLASHLVTSHCPKQVTWLAHFKGVESQTPSLDSKWRIRDH